MGTLIFNMTILSIVNAAIAGLPDPSQILSELWGSREEPNGDCGQYTRHVIQIFDNNTAAEWLSAAMK